MKRTLLLLILGIGLGLMGWGQPWNYDFGTGTGSYSTNGASTTFLPQPSTGGGEDRVRCGSTGGSFNLENPGITMGTTTELRCVAPTSTSINKMSIYDYTAGKVFNIKFTVLFGNSTGGGSVTSGTWYFFNGDGAIFSDNNAFSGTQVFSGIRWAFGSSPALTTSYRNGSSWTSISTTSSQATAYNIEIYGNNTTSSQNYFKGSTQSIASNKWDLWVDGTLIGDDLSKAQLGNDVNIDSWMFYGESSTSNAANIFLDDIEYSNTLPTGNTAPTVTTQAVSSIGTTTATGNGNITATGGVDPTARGFCWDLASNPDPDINDSKVEETPGPYSTGAFTGAISGLTAGTQYKVRAYATNSVSTGYGSVVTFYTFSTEPSSHPSSFTASTISQTQIDLSFSAASTITNAAGYIILQRSGAAPTGAPADGTGYSVGNTVGDGTVAALITSTSATSTSITSLSAGTQYYFLIFPYNWDGANAATYNYKTDGSPMGTNATTNAANNSDSKVEAPTSQIGAGNIASTATGTGSAVSVFSFKIHDLGTSDVLATKVTQVKIKKSSGTADWTDHIAGAEIWDGGTQITTGTVVITDADITFPVTSGNLDISNNSSKDITLKIWLNTSNIVDNATMVFTVSQTSHGFTADATGSTFAADFGAAVTGNTMTVTVTATKLLFTTAPSATACPNTNLSTPPVVTAKDAYNNTDTDFTGQVTLTNSGSIGMSNYQMSAVSGVANFANLQFTETGNVTLTAGASGLTNAGPTASIAISVSNVTATGATNGNAQSVVTWTNPSCYDEIMIVAKAGSAVGATPTGDGSAYAGDLAFGSGTTFDGGYVVYEGTTSPQTVTGLTNGTMYYFTFFTRKGTIWSAGVTSTATPEAVTTATDYFRSKATGNWNVAGTWESSADGNAWINSTLTPTTSANTVTILNGHEVTVSTSTSADQVIINSGGQLTISSGQTLTIANGSGTDMTVNGTLKNSGSLTTTGTLSFGDGGKYQDNHTNNEALPTATWHSNSTFEMIGYTSNTSIPANTAQTFGNFVWNCTSQSSNFQMASFSGSFAVSGSFKVLSTGSGTLRFTGSSAKTLTVTSLQIDGGTFDLASSSGIGTFIITGDFIMNGGTLTESGSASGAIQMGGSSTQYINYTSGTISNTVNFTINGSDVVLTGNPLSLPNNLTINSSKKLTIGSENALTVAGTLTNSATATGLLIESNSSGTGSLKHVTASVPATVKRYFTGVAESWHLLSSPVASQSISGDFIPSGTYEDGTGYDFYTWYEPSSLWVNFKNTTSAPTWNTANGGTSFVVGRGYMVAYQAANPTKTFTGNLSQGTINIPLSYSGTGTYQYSNLVGNPYPSSIDWKAATGWTRSFVVQNAGGYDMHIWNQAESNYGAYNSASISNDGTNGATRYIAPMQGFMVKASGAGNLTMTDDVRVHSSQAFLKSTEELADYLKLTVTCSENTYSDQAIIEFNHDSDEGGASKMFSFVAEAPSLYTTKADSYYSIDFRGASEGATVIPLNFKAGVDGTYVITASDLETFGAGVIINIEDVKTGQIQNLMDNPVYSFVASKEDETARFKLHFGGTFAVNDIQGMDNIRIYTFENSVYFTTLTPQDATISIFNITGQEVYSTRTNLAGMTQIALNVPTGWYVVKVMCDEGIKSEKIFIR